MPDTAQVKESAYTRYQRLKYELSKEELGKLFGPGMLNSGKSWEFMLEDWAPIVELATGEKTGLSTRVGGRSLGEIHGKLFSRIESSGLMVDEYFSIAPDASYNHKLEEWPEGVCAVMCYAVQGGSEGHYVHVDVQVREGSGVKLIGMFMIKTFLGMEHALRLSNTLTRIFDAVDQ